MATTRGVSYRWASSNYRVGRDDGIRIRFDIDQACGVDREVFAYRMLPATPGTGDKEGHFSHICSPVDIADYPKDAPRAGHVPEWFRLDYVDVLVRSTAEAADFMRIVREDLESLNETLNRMDTLVPGGEEQIGDVCPDSSSSESSESAASESSEASEGSLGPLESVTSYARTATASSPGAAWENVGSGAGTPTDDGNYAHVEINRGQSSQFLRLHDFNFGGLPNDAIIYGIAVELVLRDVNTAAESSSESAASESSDCAQPGRVLDLTPRLHFLTVQHPDQGNGDNRAAFEAVPGPAFSPLVFGGEDWLWTKEWTAADFKRGEFAVGCLFGLSFDAASAEVDVQGVNVTVYYR